MHTFKIRNARPKEGLYLTVLAVRSKFHWKYPAEFRDGFRELIKVDEDYISKWQVVVVEMEGSIAGFYSLEIMKGENRLQNLWIEPSFMGRGLGKALFNHAKDRAISLGWTQFRIASEPNAEKFYLKLGATKVGELRSRIMPAVIMPHLEVLFS